jgi:transcriptional regulator with XRE-family HTH domain
MDRVRIGSTFRAIRIELRMRQSDVADRAGVSQQTVSSIERGRFGAVQTDVLASVAEAIHADLAVTVRWRGPKLARLLDRRHAQLQNLVAGLIANAGWEVHAEESFNHYGERGSVDILAWRPEIRALLIVEIKTELVDLQDTIRTLDMKARVVPEVVRRSRSWRPSAVAAVLVLPDTTVHRNAVARHSALLAAALPARTIAVRRWVRDPSGCLRGIWFVLNTSPDSAIRRSDSTQRMSKPRPPVGERAGSGGEAR